MSSATSPALWYLAASLPCLFLALAAWRRTRGPSAPWLVLVAAAGAALCVVTGAERMATGLDAKLLWARLAYLPLVLLAPGWLLFAADYTSTLPWLAGWRRALLFLPAPATLALAATEPSHGLIWRRVALSEGSSPPALEVERGPWFWLVHAGWSWTLVVAGILLLAAHVPRTTPFHRPQVALVAAAPLVPLVANVLYVSGFAPLGPYDPTPLALSLSALVVSWGLSTHGLLDLKPLAYESVIQALDESVLVVDSDNRILAINPAAQRRLGRPGEAVLGRDATEVYAHFPQALERWRGVTSAHEEMRLEEGGESRDIEMRILPLENADGSVVGRVFVSHDLRLRRAYERLLEQVAHNDPLTGLANRRAFQHFADKALAFAGRRQQTAALMFVDLDAFQRVNERWGQSVGNELLAAVGQRLARVMRRENVAARLGGDEFAVLLQGADHDAARAAARNLKRELEPPYTVSNAEIALEASIGVALFPRDGAGVSELLARADVAMSEAKRTRTGLAFYDSRLEGARGPGRICFVEQIEEALQLGQIRPFYQPIVDTALGTPVAVEALARWRHPERGVVLPAHFLPIAESRRTLLHIDRRILEIAVAEIAPTALDLSVNVSIGRLLDDGFVEELEAALARHAFEPSRLILEITETELASPDRVGPVLRTLRGLGVRIATDDFGSGYSSLGYLRRLPLDQLKVEQTLIDGIGGRAGDEAIVAAILTVARNLGLSIVAEGVERESQREWLERERCPMIQGFLVERALPHDELVAWLASRRATRSIQAQV